MIPYLYQINVSDGGVPKHAVSEAWVTLEGINGDRQRNGVIHGGPERALCLFSLEVIQALQQEGHFLKAGSTGENLTFSRLNWAALKPGSRLRIGPSLFVEITSYCEPCRHNAKWFRGEHYTRISQKIHPGWSRLYARVLNEGLVRQGDPVHIQSLSHVRM